MTPETDRFRDAVVAVLGAAPDDIEPGRLHRFSTSSRRSDMSGWCKLFDDLGAGVFGDFRAGVSETWSAAGQEWMTRVERVALQRHIAQAKVERQVAQRDVWRKAEDNMRYLWRQCRPIEQGDPVNLYLRHRLALDTFDAPSALRFHPAMPFAHDGVLIGDWPAMVAPLIDATGKAAALHRTYLTPDGRKADVPGPVRKLTPACGLRAAGRRLHSPSRAPRRPVGRRRGH